MIRSLRAASAGSSLRPALALLAIVLVTACGGGEQAAAGPVATTRVDLPPSYRFDPADITVSAGSTVTWANNDNFTHNVAFEAERPLMMAPGESATRRFESAGVYPYVCSLHPRDMTGSVTVTEG